VSSPHSGDELDVAVERSVFRGQGMARHEGRVVFVPRAIPGDRWRVRIAGVTAGYLRAAPLELLERGPGRRVAPCAHAGPCGGCAYQEVEPATQLSLKEAVLRDALSRAGVPWEGPIGVHASPGEGWRTRATLHVDAGRLALGLHEEGSRRVVDLERCLQLSGALNAAARALLGGLRERPHLARRIRDVELAESPDGRQLVVGLAGPFGAAQATELAPLQPAMASGLLGIGRDRRPITLRGAPYLFAEVGGVRLRWHAAGFFQGNRFLLGELVERVLSLLPGPGPLLDLYAGVGLFALPLARAGAGPVHAVEQSSLAVDDSRWSARAAGLDARLEQDDVGEALGRWPVEPGERIVLDPPRTGAGAGVIAALAARRPVAVVYVSCDPPTLGRDLRSLSAAGYVPDSIDLFDLFPDTYHLETVVRLRPR
jgi:23S rRNA (uracil1939-C5)-methyltransferase